MNRLQKTNTSFPMQKSLFSKTLTSLAFSVICFVCFSASPDNDTNNDPKLLDEYIKSNYQNSIVFDANNIKQFWVDKSVVSMDNKIKILLEEKHSKWESVPLRIKFANVDETMDCKIDVISKSSAPKFKVMNDSLKSFSESRDMNQFVEYNISSATFHMEDTCEHIINLVFNSNVSSSSISLDKIIISFSNNKNSSFLSSPGNINISDLYESQNSFKVEGNSLTATGKQVTIQSNKKILITERSIFTLFTIKNLGNEATRIYAGFEAFTKEHISLNPRNYPYKDNQILTIVEAEVGNKTLLVDSYPEWGKGNWIAIHPQEDLSDIPSINFLNGSILDIKKIDDNRAEIKITSPINMDLPKGTKIRIHGNNGGALYINSFELKPGEEKKVSFETTKRDDLLEFSSKGFSRGTYYVQPLIRSFSIDSTKDNTISITDYSVSF